MLSVWKWVMVWSEGELLLIVIFLEYKQSPLWTLLSIYTLPSFVHSLGLVIHTFFQRVCLNSGVVCTHIFTYESRFYSLYKRFLRNWWSLGNIDVSQWLILFSKIVLVFLMSCVISSPKLWISIFHNFQSLLFIWNLKSLWFQPTLH